MAEEQTCPMCGAKVASPEAMEDHKKEAHGGSGEHEHGDDD